MATSTDTLRSTIGSILVSDAAQKIDFYLDNIHVDGSGFSYVALALVPKPSGARGLSIAVGHMNPLAAATYAPLINTYRLPRANYGITPFERMTILHESVHALRDSMGRTVPTSTGHAVTRAVSDEAAALVAGALFFILDAGPRSASDTTPTWAQSGVYSNAMSLALQILQESNPKGCDVKKVNSVGLDAIKVAILHSPTYRHLRSNPQEVYDNNGVKL
jgi:hypothetical protein